MVSIARALSQDAKLIIMDEPSAVLDNEEVERLFGVIRDLTAHDVAVVYISHRLEEIRQIGDRITVLKDGRTVATGLPARETPTREVITLMTGRTIEYVFPPRQAAPPAGEPAARGRGAGPARQLRRRQLRRPPGRDRRPGRPGRLGALGDPRDHLRRPEGDRRDGPAGRQAAARRATSAPRWPAASASPRRSARARRCCSTTPSTATSRVSSLGRFARGGFLSGRAERAAARAQTESLDVRPADVTRIVRTLSGGNQQKVVLARWLLRDCKVLLLDEPTRGVDVGARSEIYALVRTLADRGVAVVVVSSEIPEVLGLADRVLVIADGAVVAEAPADALDEHRVLDLVMEGTPHAGSALQHEGDVA